MNAQFGWKDWCIQEDFRDCDEENSIVFTLKDNADILYLEDPKDLDNLPKIRREYPHWTILDFEELLRVGYDAVEVKIDKLYWDLYGWDCDSILIMNKNIIEVKE